MTSKSTIAREQATDKEIQMLIDSHENGTAMFMRTDAYYFMAKELQERRKAAMDSEPVAVVDIQRGRGDGRKYALCYTSAGHSLPDDVYNLYVGPQPAPVVPEMPEEATPESIEILASIRPPHGVAFQWDADQRNAAADSWNACRGAMLQAGTFRENGNSSTESFRDIPETSTNRSHEHFISLCNEFWNWSEMDLVCSDDRGYELRMEWDGKVFKHPVTQALWRMYQASPGNSPVIPDGYVMVPKEPTEAMMLHKSGCQHHAWDDPDCAMRQTRRLIWSHMLAAAPQGSHDDFNSLIKIVSRNE